MTILSPRLAVGVACLGLATACTTVAPRYEPVPVNVVRLREAGLEPVRIGAFAAADPAQAGALNRLTIRGGAYLSPYQGSYVDYLKEALTADLREARLLDPASPVAIAGFLVANDLDASGFSTAHARMDARFQVTRSGSVTFDKVLSARFEWDSHLLGQIAIPRAMQNYPIVVQQLLAKLYADPEFNDAMKQK